MKLDVVSMAPRLADMPAYAQAVEALGFGGLWTSETQHDPFLPLALAAEHTTRVNLGTAIAVAFARSPTVLAHMAWDLQGLSGGRMVLGLGTQVKAHIERRFGMPWESPAPKLRDMILAIRDVWKAWQGDGRVNHRGPFYSITLMTPFFNPGPLDAPVPPIWIAGVNEHLAELAGELCEGFHVHSFHTPKYLREFLIPHIEKGLQKGGRTRDQITLFSALFVATNELEREMVRQQISFYASTPSYRAVFDTHGWGEIAEKLSSLAARQKWMEMPLLITDDMLEEFAILGTAAQVPGKVRTRYAGLLDRIAFYMPFEPGREDDKWKGWIEELG